MDIERFNALAQAYGGRIGCWPEPEREAAINLLEADTRAASILRENAALDILLDDWRAEPADMILRQAVLASIDATSRPRAGRAVSMAPWLRDLRLWLAGAGLAAGLAGVFCGAVLSTAAVGEARDEALVASAVSDTAVSVPVPAQT